MYELLPLQLAPQVRQVKLDRSLVVLPLVLPDANVREILYYLLHPLSVKKLNSADVNQVDWKNEALSAIHPCVPSYHVPHRTCLLFHALPQIEV